jgi:hypothetical protein
MTAIFGCCSEAAVLFLLLLSLLLAPQSMLKPIAAPPAFASAAAAAPPASAMDPNCPLARLLPVRLLLAPPSTPPAGAINTLPIM